MLIMENPFEIIIEKIDNIERMLIKLSNKQNAETMVSNSEEFLSIDKVADYLNLSKSAIYKFTMKNEIPYFKRSRKLYFKRKEIEKWLEEGKVKTKTELIAEINQHVQKSIRRK